MATDVINTDTLAHIVDAISTNLGIAAKQIFDVFVGAQPIIGILNIASLLLVILVTYWAWRISRKAIIAFIVDDSGDYISKDDQFCAVCIQIIVVVIIFCISWAIVGAVVEPSILKITCPEYAAMKEIIGLVSP